MRTLLNTLAEKETVALIYILGARLTDEQVKTIGDTLTRMEMEALVETSSDPVIKMKSKRRSTQ